MIGLLQRVSNAAVLVDDTQVAAIDAGLLVLVGIQKDDTKQRAKKLLERLLYYRVFADEQGKMNLSLNDCGAGLLLVPQFTLAADTSRGRRPGFQSAADPVTAKQLFEYLCEEAKSRFSNTKVGVFGADMQVQLNNDGPVTFWLES